MGIDVEVGMYFGAGKVASALVWAWVVLRVFKLYADVGVVASFTVSERETEPLAPIVKTAHGRIRLTNAYSYSTKVVGFGGRRSLRLIFLFPSSI
ncbi:hypothetical protein E1B28_013855 [Marasmius oreades]|uniref:Uncharacterized protein n=1 Tax=Marasmius oreades TaxID=181124 RepID=A0A9P7RLC9_9AGAR|nr:uncharacterized protein E1B28_013855 [Marasmius oreades]KAG7085315.1 hypothetical protein E1B28_013855 [Marasmius oreades]